ncbi:M10 family metallopeptidase C-terminal domain-containing protein [Aquicoccus porphyridii]|uniref:M10 family metallopeptidase C-terminal domain-containing protein n=1 Tax=Aquicoccus porphyridii TaxID=1852029 RepID=UPI00273D9A31|nr:M10 family metallopeptidase C-terminal domain-containing protein [Aquicoccus porphyridii]
MAGSKTVAANSNTLLAGLQRTNQWDSSSLTYWIAEAGDSDRIDDIYEDKYGVAPAADNPHEPINQTTAPAWDDAIENALYHISLATGLSFTEDTSVDTGDIIFSGGYPSTAGVVAWMNGPGTMLKPDETDDYQSFLTNRMGNATYDQAAETGAGSFADFVILHELGHGLGLSHPHNSDSGTTAWANSAATSADNKADNARYTVMSYEIGGIDTQVFSNFGNSVTLAALDIAALQAVHGAPAAHTGNTVYTLTDQGSTARDLDGSDGSISIGRAFYTIWDTGGTDEIDYSGANNAYINLQDASLVQEARSADAAILEMIRKTDAYGDMKDDHGDGATSQPRNELIDPNYHAGGYVSTISDGGTGTQLGGYTIANGVVIENATGGSGNDMLIGNGADNELIGNDGDDMLAGGAGDDTLEGGAGDDELIGGAGDDMLDGGAGHDVAYFSGPCSAYTIDRDDDGVVTISHLDGSGSEGVNTLVGVEEAKFSDATIELLGEEDPECPPLDFIFLVDLSGSFFDDLPNFVTAAKQIAADLRDENPDVQFSIASFIDKPESPWGSPGDYLYQAHLESTSDVTAFETTLDGLSTKSGGDFPEAQWVGLYRAARGDGLNLREDASRMIYLATDASAHDASDYGLDESTIQAFLDGEDIDVEGGSALSSTESTDDDGMTSSGEGDTAGLEIEPDPRDPDDPGHDTGNDEPVPTDDLLLGAVGDALRDFGAVPIIGTSSSFTASEYEEALADMGSEGVVVATSGDSSDVADAVRAGRAAIAGDVTETGTSGADSLVGTEEDDVILGLGGNDTIEGLGGNDTLDGGAGNDSILGGDDNDAIFGGTGADTLDGGAGDDLFSPGAGIDVITTGAGADVITGPANSLDGDTVTDMSAEDRVLVRFTRMQDDPTLEFDGANTLLSFDTTGDGTQDFSLTFEGDVTGLDLLISNAGEDVRIGTPPNMALQVNDRDGNPLDVEGATFRGPGDTEASGAAGGTPGSFTFMALGTAEGTVMPELPYDATDHGAPSAPGALEALRLAVGLNPSWGPAGGEDFIAADFNGDGDVTAGDALDMLRLAVGLEADHAPRWVFVNSESDTSGFSADNVDVEAAAMAALPGFENDISMTGILVGDMRDFG